MKVTIILQIKSQWVQNLGKFTFNQSRFNVSVFNCYIVTELK